MSIGPLTKSTIDALLKPDNWKCEWDRYFESTRIFGVSSASATIQGIVKAKKIHPSDPPLDMFFKIMPDIDKIHPGENTENRHIIEPFIYRYLTNLIYNNVTPNLMEYIGMIHCDDIIPIISLDPDLENRVSGWFEGTPYEDWDIEDAMAISLKKGNIMLIELGNGMSLSQMIKDPSISLTINEFKTIIFQIAYTLDQMARVHIRHNDLHAGNVWINILDSPTKMVYQTASGTFTIHTRYVAKIFDFDLSAYTYPGANASIRNYTLDDYFCHAHGMCQSPDLRFDLVTVMYSIYASVVKEEISFETGAYKYNKINAKWVLTSNKGTPLPDKEQLRVYNEFIESFFTDQGITELIYSKNHYTFAGRFCYDDQMWQYDDGTVEFMPAKNKKNASQPCDDVSVPADYMRIFKDVMGTGYFDEFESTDAPEYTSIELLNPFQTSRLNSFELLLEPSYLDAFDISSRPRHFDEL